MPPDASTTSFRQELTAAIAAAISDGRIGSPVFVRWTARIAAGHHADDAVQEGIDSATMWFGVPPEHVHRSGESPGYTAAHVKWPSGGAAIVTAGPCLPGGRPSVDVMVLGSSGAIYHDGQAVRRLDMVD